MVGDIPLVSRIELEAQKGLEFDSMVVDACIENLSGANGEYRLGRQADFLVQFQKVRFLRDIA